MTLVTLIDYESGNLHSAYKALERMALEQGSKARIMVTHDPKDVARADRIVLPGDGAFPACRHALMAKNGLDEALHEAVVTKQRPFLGICVGMQMLATWGHEYADTQGFGWISGDVIPIQPHDRRLKVPHMGWNDLHLDAPDHPIFKGITAGDHVYFVHSYHFQTTHSQHVLAHTDYGHHIAAVVGHKNILGFQFHPEKSQQVGLKMISNFLNWHP